jgi:hypothetical protein
MYTSNLKVLTIHMEYRAVSCGRPSSELLTPPPGGEGVGVLIFGRKTPNIGLASYIIIPLRRQQPYSATFIQNSAPFLGDFFPREIFVSIYRFFYDHPIFIKKTFLTRDWAEF